MHTSMCIRVHMPIISARKNMLDQRTFFFFLLFRVMMSQGAFPSEQAGLMLSARFGAKFTVTKFLLK